MYRRTTALLAFLLVAVPASASEQVQIPLSRGLLEFHAGNYPQALERFDEALQADPNDIPARYYRGVTRGRLRDFEGAISDLRAVLAARPDLDQAALELGVALFESGAYREAIPWLEQAQRAPASEADASFFLGLALLELGQLDAAQSNLERAARHEAFHARARYYLGVAASRQRQWDAAREHFRYVADKMPESEIGRQAAAYLRLLRPYRFYGAIGFAYDSNVVLAPSDGVVQNELGISDQADGSTTIRLGGAYALWQNALAQLWFGYQFEQTVQFQLTEFNLQDHRPALQFLLDGERAQLGILASYDYYLLESDSFFQQPLGMTWLTLPETDLTRSELFYRFRWRGFYEQPFRVHNGYNNAAGITQYFNLFRSDRYVWAGYQFDHEQPQHSAGNPFGYDGNEVGGGVGARLPAAILGEASYAYRHESYDAASRGRRDNEHLITVTARRALTEYVDVVAGFFGDINNSNQPVFEYDRYVGSIAVEVAF